MATNPVDHFSADIGDPRARRMVRLCEHLAPGEAWLLADLAGPACVRVLRFAAGWQMPGLVLRCTWDDEAAPSVEVPLLDLLGGGQPVQAPVLWAVPGGPAELRIPMPFIRTGRLEVLNLGGQPVTAECPLAAQVDYQALKAEEVRVAPATLHAQWVRPAERLAGRPLPACRATGYGAYLGCTVRLPATEAEPLAALNDLLWVDGEGRSQVLAAGHQPAGAPVAIPPGPCEGFTPGAGCYRFYADAPVVFRHSLTALLPGLPPVATAVSFWHQFEPHRERLVALAPEHLADVAGASRALPTGAQERVEWLLGEGDRKLVAHDHLLDLSALQAAKGDSTAVLSATFVCAETRSARLYLSYEGHARLSLDGRLLSERERVGGFGSDPIATMVAAGEHTVRLETTYRADATCGAWLLGFRVANSEGRTLQDVAFRDFEQIPEA
jgi:hypothetical protein